MPLGPNGYVVGCKDLDERIIELEAALTEIRGILPLVNDEYARRIFRIAANALEPEAT